MRLHPLTAALLLAACAPAGTDDVLARQAQPIFGGTRTSAHRAVLGLVSNSWGAPLYCTGTLVEGGYVITAAHCVMDSSNRPTNVPAAFFTCADRRVDGARTDCFLPPVLSDPDNWGLPWVHPRYDGSEQNMQFDIAVVRTQPGPIAPAKLPPGPLPLAAEDTLARIVGYGLSDGFENTEAKFTATTLITHVGPKAPGQTDPNPDGLAAEAFQNAGHPNTCSGDSGGPVLWPADGPDQALVGTVSWGDEGCSDFGVNVDVGEHLCWLASIGVPGATCRGQTAPEDCGNGRDDDLDGAVDCADADCGSDAACQQGSACTGAPTISCGQRVFANVLGGSRVLSTYSCQPDHTWDLTERAYRIDAPPGTRVVASLTPDERSDLDLFAIRAGGDRCPPTRCFASSVEGPGVVDVVEFDMPADGAYLVVDAYDRLVAFNLEVRCAGTAETDCVNRADDDGDGSTDCADADCAPNPVCTPREDCGNAADDDGDGAADCADADCAALPACAARAEVCGNGADDDRDGRADCADTDCAAACEVDAGAAPRDGGSNPDAGSPADAGAGPGDGGTTPADGGPGEEPDAGEPTPDAGPDEDGAPGARPRRSTGCASAAGALPAIAPLLLRRRRRRAEALSGSVGSVRAGPVEQT